jgi:hypothetical protein
VPLLGNSVAYAKTTPSSRPDVEVNVLMSKQEVESEEGGTEIKWSYVTDGTFDRIGSDLGKLPKVFEIVAMPAVHDFFEQHKSDLAGKYVDTLFIRYRPYNNEIFVSVWYSFPLYESMTANALPEQYSLELADEVSFKISILKQFPGLDQEHYHSWVDFNILEYNLLPLASVRVEYLSDSMRELYLGNKETLIKDDTTLSLPEKEPIILDSISAVMFQEMSRVDIHYMDRTIGLYGGRITEYDTAYFESRDYAMQDSEKDPTAEQLQECQELGIDEDNCSDTAILQKIPRHAAIDVEEMAKKDAAVSSTLAMVGIGAAGVGAIAIITLRKLRK